MKISGEQSFRATKWVVYRGVMDPEILQKCIPGCRTLSKVEEGQYAAELELGIAAIKGHYTGKVDIRDPEPPNQYTMLVSGTGGPGFINAEIKFSLDEINAQTFLRYDGEVEVGGTIAAVGQRVTGGIAKLISKQFFSAIAKEIDKADRLENSV